MDGWTEALPVFPGHPWKPKPQSLDPHPKSLSDLLFGVVLPHPHSVQSWGLPPTSRWDGAALRRFSKLAFFSCPSPVTVTAEQETKAETGVGCCLLCLPLLPPLRAINTQDANGKCSRCSL